MDKMNITERLDETDSNNEWLLNYHKSIYNYILPFVKNRKVLDIACGFGFAANIYSDNGASSVIGVDISEEVISAAKIRCGNRNITFLQGNAENLAILTSDSFDLLTSVETIEHLNDHVGFIREAYRLLNKEGLFIISTPNRLTSNKQNSYHLFLKYFANPMINNNMPGCSSFILTAKKIVL